MENPIPTISKPGLTVDNVIDFIGPCRQCSQAPNLRRVFSACQSKDFFRDCLAVRIASEFIPPINDGNDGVEA